MTDPAFDRPLRITGLLPWANDGSLGGRGWKDAGIRLRCVGIAAHLGALGPEVRLVESRNLSKRIADGSFFDGDVYVIYQTLEDHRDVVGALVERGKCVVVDVCDDVTEAQGVLGYTWENARRAAALTVPTTSLAERLARRLDTPIHVVPDTVEGLPQPVRPPRADGALRLFWYGWQHKIGTLAERMPELEQLASRRPLHLTVMTNMNPIRPALQGILSASSARLTIAAEPWQLAAFQEAMTRADIAIIPYNDSVANSGRSPVRLIQAVWQGRLAISEDVDGYPEFAAFGLLHRSVVEGVGWALDDPEAASRALGDAHRYVAQTYHPAVVARRWLRSLSEIHRRFVGMREG